MTKRIVLIVLLCLLASFSAAAAPSYYAVEGVEETKIELWKNKQDKRVLFIPGFVQQEWDVSKWVLKYKGSPIPVIFLTADDSANKLLTQKTKDYSVTGKMTVVDENGEVIASEQITKLRLRGNSTVQYPKKPFQVKLESKVSLFGMEASKTWVLLANYIDRSLLRNVLAYRIADQAGLNHITQYQPVEVYYNGLYQGLYLLTEKVEFGKGRITVDDGYLLEVYQTARHNHDQPDVVLPSGWSLLIKEPSTFTQEDIDFIYSLFEPIDAALSDPDGLDRLSELVDMDSFLKKYVLDEFLINYDAGAGSQYFTVDMSGDKPVIYSGPAWDYDNILGVNKIAADHSKFHNGDRGGPTSLYRRLRAMRGFDEKVRLCYQTDFKQVIEEAFAWLPSQADLIRDSANMNFKRWPIYYTYNKNVINTGSSFDANVKYLTNFMNKRKAFIDKKWLTVK